MQWQFERHVPGVPLVLAIYSPSDLAMAMFEPFTAGYLGQQLSKDEPQG